MDCDKVREVVKQRDVLAVVGRHEFHLFLKHVRTCPECRSEISDEERAMAIHAIVMALE